MVEHRNTLGLLQALRQDRALARAFAVLYVLLGFFIGIAHRAPVLAAGVAPVFCLTGEAGNDTRDGISPCDACLITAAPGLLAAPPALPTPMGQRSEAMPAASLAQVLAVHAQPPPARGPPDIMHFPIAA